MTGRRQTALITGGAGFIGSHMADLLIDRGYRVRIVDNLVGGRAANIAQHRSNPEFSFEEADIRRFQPGDSLFADVDYVFHFAGIGDIVPSIERPLEYMSVNVQGTVHTIECARHAGIGKFVYAASSSCYGLAATPTREDHPIAPQYPYALSKYQGEQAAFHWHKVYRLPVNSIRIFNAYGTRSRTSGAYGAVFGVFLRQKLAGQAVHRRRRRHADAAISSMRRTSPKRFWRRPRPRRPARSGTSAPGNPQSVNRLVELLGGEVVHIPKRPGEPDCTHADIGKITRDLGWRPEGQLRGRRRAHRGGDRLLARRAAVGRRSRSPRRRPAGSRRSCRERASDGRRQPEPSSATRSRRAEEVAAIIGPPPRDKKVIMCHGTFDIVHPGHVRHLLYAKSKGDILVASLTADAHIDKANFRPFVPQELRAFNLAALEVVDYVVIDSEATPIKNIGIIKPDYFAKGYEYTKQGLHPQHGGGEGRRRVLWRRNHVHARRHRLFLLAAHRDRSRRRSPPKS